MKKQIIPVIAAVLVGLAAAGNGQDSLTGEQIAQKVLDANRSSKGVVIKANLVLKNLESGASETRKIMLIAVEDGGLKKGLVRFIDSSYSGTTMLTIERSGKDNLQYLYLPSVGSPRQIEGSDRENNFVDTDFSNEDMGGSKISDYSYKRLDDQKYNDYDCYTIERTPKSKKSKFSKHIVIIDKSTMIPVSVQSYGTSGRVIKTMKAGQIKKIGTNINIPYYIEIVDVEKKHQTAIGVYEASEKKVSRGYFNKNKMNSKWAEE